MQTEDGVKGNDEIRRMEERIRELEHWLGLKAFKALSHQEGFGEVVGRKTDLAPHGRR